MKLIHDLADANKFHDFRIRLEKEVEKYGLITVNNQQRYKYLSDMTELTLLTHEDKEVVFKMQRGELLLSTAVMMLNDQAIVYLLTSCSAKTGIFFITELFADTARLYEDKSQNRFQRKIEVVKHMIKYHPGMLPNLMIENEDGCFSPLWFCALNSSAEMLELLLNNSDRGLNKLYRHTTPLMNAINSAMDKTEKIKRLLKAGADPNQQNVKGLTALLANFVAVSPEHKFVDFIQF